MSEEALFRWLNGLAGPVFDDVVTFLVNDYLIPVAAALTLGWLWFAGRDDEETDRFQSAAVAALLAMAWITAMVQITNAVWPRPRPFVTLPNIRLLFYMPRDPSFPAHPVAIVTGMGAAVFKVHRPLGTGVMTLAVVFGLLRIVAGVWYPTDVLGGIVYGMAGGYLGWWLFRQIPGTVAALRSFAERLDLA